MINAVKRLSPDRLVVVPALIAVVLALAACADVEVSSTECDDGGELWTEYRLFMGRGVDGVELVSDDDWEAFLADTITPRFPDGLSVIDVAGQGGSGDAVDRERTKMLLVLAPLDDAAALDRINEIGAEYKQRFSQNSVLRVITEACVAFK